MLDWLFKFGLKRSAERRGVSPFFFGQDNVASDQVISIPEPASFAFLPLSSQLRLVMAARGMSPLFPTPAVSFSRSPLSEPWVARLNNGLATVVRGISPANGYTTTVTARNFFQGYRPEFDTKLTDKDFPKCILMFEDANCELRPSGDITHDARFLVAYINRKSTGPAASHREAAYDFADDLDRALHLNSSLGGAAVSAQVSKFFIDSGYSEPESFGVFRLQVLHHHL